MIQRLAEFFCCPKKNPELRAHLILADKVIKTPRSDIFFGLPEFVFLFLQHPLPLFPCKRLKRQPESARNIKVRLFPKDFLNHAGALAFCVPEAL